MNTMNNAQAQELTSAIISLTAAVNELIVLAKEEETEAASTTATETTATTTTDAEATTAETTTTTTAPIIVIDDDDNVIATTEENAAEANADTAEENADKYLDNILCDISTLYDIADYTLGNEGYNVSIDNSPYAPENKVASIDNYKVYISKEIIKGDTDVTGEFRLIVSEKNSGVKILDHSLKIINDHIKVFSSENTVRIDMIKDNKKLMRFMELVDEVSALVMSKYISK